MDTLDEEFAAEPVTAALVRVLLLFGAMVLFIVGFVLFFGGLLLIGNLAMASAILLFAYNTYLSVHDKLSLKWFNVFGKAVLTGLFLLIMLGLNG